MGHGSYTANDWLKLKKSKKIESGTTNSLFSRCTMNPKMDPKFVGKREARDSEEHPESTPIMIGVDVTGSMGYLSTQIIKESLNDLMQLLYSSDYVRDPQLLFAAIGDAKVDSAPLQVTQFESDIRIAEQLLELWLENYGGDLAEDYELLWYFAAKHTDIDCFNKRNQKGYCFTIGDAPCHDTLAATDIKRIFSETSKNYSSRELAEKASEKYELFHIMIGNDNNNINEIIPGRMIRISKTDIKYLPEIIISTIQLTKNRSFEDVLNQWSDLTKPIVKNALSLLSAGRKNSISF